MERVVPNLMQPLLPRSIVHGTHETVNRVCDHPEIEAISFVGSNAAGQYIYERGSRSGKRIQVPLLSAPCITRLDLAISAKSPTKSLQVSAPG